ncbi:laccase [Sistotremastrum niveocremeum HHB9708]|uniref:Laccase n=1 Tax=Sistotremastrum niveocremeum HHB9708 TaxID=1314777 RepID=A0A164PSC2_9AGAM|nr:laccase [Sistotremastrum niveocremeum HHB9708]
MLFSLANLVSAALALARFASAATQTYSLELDTGTVSPDGFDRLAITVNGGFGGPLLTANKGDTIQANVANSIENTAIFQSTSIHWHGMFQHRTNTEDGVGMVTQCPIVPGESYDYSFDTAGQTGTYWYHSHVSTQYCDGLRGPLVIYDPNDPFADMYDVDDELFMCAPQTPDSVLINGQGRYVGGPTDSTAPLTVISVTSGTRYRFRLINVSCLTYFTVSLDGHTFTVIEADGVEHQPLVVDSLTIFVGQRYSIVVDASEDVDNYWFRVVPGPSIVNQASSTDPSLNNAIFRYEGAPVADPTTTPTPSTNPLVEASMIPLVNPGAPGGDTPPDVAHVLTIGLDVTSVSLSPNWTINGSSFAPPSVPVLLQILSGASTAQGLLPPGSVIPLPSNSIVEISIPDTGAVSRTHPFHLHGHNFDVIRSAGQTDFNYVNPPRRDVSSPVPFIPDNAEAEFQVVAVNSGNVTFRFKTDNPGPWILHCHIDWHLKQGLAVVLAEDPAGVVSGPDSVIIPPAWNNLCSAFDASGLPSN